MKLVTFSLAPGGAPLAGALLTIHETGNGVDQVIDLHAANPALPETVIGILKGGASMLAAVRSVLENPPPGSSHARDSVTLHAPIPRPGKIICIGLNYRDHAEETGQAVPQFPTVFAKFNTCVIGTGAPIVIPRATSQVDYEAEFAVVMGDCPRNVSEADALRYVAGYVPFNDVSARDLQNRTSQWTMGKTPDTFGPMGPALVTADEIPDPHALDIHLDINGEVLQRSNTRNLIFNVAQLIADLSSVMTLEAGDLISTGTPAGVGAARTPKRFLRAGDVVNITIEKLGTLSNPVTVEP